MSTTTTTFRKPNQRTKLAAIDAILDAAEKSGIQLDFDGLTYTDLHDFVASQTASLDKKQKSAAARAAEKKQEGDALRTIVLDALSTTEYMTIADISAVINTPDNCAAVGVDPEKGISNSMISSRLTQLGEKGTNQVEKADVNIAAEGEKKHNRVGYKRIA